MSDSPIHTTHRSLETKTESSRGAEAEQDPSEFGVIELAALSGRSTRRGILALQRLVGNQIVHRLLTHDGSLTFGRVQRFSGAEVAEAAKPGQAQTTVGIVQYFIGKHTDDKKDPAGIEAAAEYFMEVAQRLGLSESDLYELPIQAAYKDADLVSGNALVVDILAKVKAVKSALNRHPEVRGALQRSFDAALENFTGDLDLRAVLDTALQGGSNGAGRAPQGAGVLIGGLRFTVDSPVLAVTNPHWQRDQRSHWIDGSSCLFSFAANVRFDVVATGPTKPGDWKIGIIQNAKGNRKATYDDGSSVSRVFDWCLDTSTVPFFMGQFTKINGRDPGHVLAYLQDSPGWAYARQSESKKNARGHPKTVTIQDEFRMWVVVQEPNDGPFHPLLRQDWTFAGSDQALSYAPVGAPIVLTGAPIGEMKTAPPLTKEYTDVWQD